MKEAQEPEDMGKIADSVWLKIITRISAFLVPALLFWLISSVSQFAHRVDTLATQMQVQQRALSDQFDLVESQYADLMRRVKRLEGLTK
ncbi:MAG: hypothetical protein KGH75_01000 [Rhodospirillales bacterium]|nr:hypothetical protein [Rhodospirillales bacterium]